MSFGAPVSGGFGSSAGGFSFGGSSSGTAGGGFSFGSSGNTTPPSSNTSFSFGGAPNPVPAGGGFSFGNPAPAPSAGGGFSFGNPAPASSTGFSFGNPAPAPSTGFSFASPSPAPALAPSSGFSFGTPAPSTGFSFSQPSITQQQPGASLPPLSGVTGKTPYSSLPPEYKKVIDDIHEAMMKHKRSMIQVQAMGPATLITANNNNKNQALPGRCKALRQSLSALYQQLVSLQASAIRQRDENRQLLEQAYLYAKWPTEAMAARRGIRLSPVPSSSATTTVAASLGGGAEEKKDDSHTDIQAQLRDMLERQLPYVDRIERMPSPYLWQTLDRMTQRLQALSNDITALQQQLESSQSLEDTGVFDLASIVDNQDQFLYSIRREIHKIHHKMQQLRNMYGQFETGDNVVERAQLKDWEHQKGIEEQIQMRLLQSAPSTTTPGSNPTTAAPAPSSGFSFGGGTLAAPAPSSTSSGGGFLFGASSSSSNPAPAPSSGVGSFGSSTFSTPAFGATPAPSFGVAKPSASAPSLTPKRKGTGRSSNRSRR